MKEATTSTEIEAGLLDELVADIRGVIGDDLLGLYLYGSAVTGGFDPGASDIDPSRSPRIKSIRSTWLVSRHERQAAGNFIDRLADEVRAK